MLLLAGVAFLAGLIDSIVGGGGLLQLPALLVALPGLPIATVFGTNKLVSMTGTATATYRYRTSIGIDWRRVLPPSAAAFAFSFLGASTVHVLDKTVLRPVVLTLLIAVAIYTALRPDFGNGDPALAARGTTARARATALTIGAGIGFYDGFFGPGTGSFLIFLFIGLCGLDFRQASAEAKVVNLATNLAALAFFVPSGNVVYALALPMAACNVAGAIVGSRLAVSRGNRFIRVLFLVVVSAIIARFAYDTVARAN